MVLTNDNYGMVFVVFNFRVHLVGSNRFFFVIVLDEDFDVAIRFISALPEHQHRVS